MVYNINYFTIMKNYKLTLQIIGCLLFMSIVNQSHAQRAEIKETTYKAYLNKDMDLWKKGAKMSQEAYDKNSTNSSLMDLAMAQYGVLNATVIEKDEDIFDDYEDAAIDNIEKLMDSDNKWGEPKAVLSSIYGLKMAYSPWKGIYLGSKSSNLMDKATRQSKESPVVWKLYANSKLYTPESFGGDKTEAAQAFEKAITLFEKVPEQTKNNWIYLDALAHLGITYMKLDKPKKAQEVFEKALEVEPEFNWVKYILLPQVTKG